MPEPNFISFSTLQTLLASSDALFPISPHPLGFVYVPTTTPLHPFSCGRGAPIKGGYYCIDLGGWGSQGFTPKPICKGDEPVPSLFGSV
ncbi:hypothetical protein RRG08_029610 [Elysia crispata]|uniref:Uncharacterized protein n=1 Tax=Elysia crispata TaxID=231223 RepID=A0AAE0XPM8_9GAST|nr:hypothetical protein RRG08_029610 [Elysia crispata]